MFFLRRDRELPKWDRTLPSRSYGRQGVRRGRADWESGELRPDPEIIAGSSRDALEYPCRLCGSSSHWRFRMEEMLYFTWRPF